MDFAIMVGGAVLAPLIQSLLDSPTCNDLFTYARGSKVLEEVSKWEPMLRTIFEVLEDAEEQEMTDGKVPSWFNGLRNLAYDVDDTLDELITHARQRKLLSETSSSKVGKLHSSGLNLNSRIKFSSGMVSNVKKISNKLGIVKEQMDLLKNVGGRNNRVNKARLTMALLMTSLPTFKVFGRDDDRKAILDMMMNDAGGRRVSVMAIVGMAGVGKTTIAQMVYNDESLKFDFRAWASIGEAFDLITVTKTIAQEGGDLNSLQNKLKEKLYGKKFLVVLDDLWSDDYNKWTLFYRPFEYGAPGSKIIITTRNNKVSSMTSSGNDHPLSYHLEILSNDDCLSLFVHHALNKEDFRGHMDLMEVGKQIAKICQGLPLVAKLLGGLLRGRPYLDYWNNLLQDKLWEVKTTIIATLKLCYYNLSPPLRRCFAYFAIFPKEYEFDRHSLVLLWLAEGFLPNLTEGYDYFDELFARCLFEKSAKDTSLFVMHDLIHDFARSISGGVCFNLDEESICRESYTEARHSTFNRGELDFAPRFKNFENMECLRTILALPIFKERDDETTYFISTNVLRIWILKLKCLRVLSLSGYKILKVPKSIYHLQHLRYLNLCGAEIVTLPKSVCKLFNLQVLILRKCKNLRRLPGNLCNLINLQCLDLEDTDSLEGMPLHIGNLSKLLILTKFIVGSTDGCRIKELLKIPNLQGEVHIKELQNVMDTDCSSMEGKKNIDGLVLEWADNFGVYRDEENEKKVLEALQPQNNIARISVKSYGGLEFPSWFGNDSFKLTVLEMYNCRNVSSLPPLGGLPSLKELRIEGMSAVKEVGLEFYGVVSSSASSSSCLNVFPSLEILNFQDMENWKVWSCFNNVEYEGHVFPKLRKLGIKSCPKLVGDFPKSLQFLEELVFENCDEVQHLWQSGTEIERLGFLKDLKILNCSKLVSLVEGEEGIFPPNLHLLEISCCVNLERLPNQLHSLKSLATFSIYGCPKLATVGDLPDNVKEVKILDCDSLGRFPEGIMVDQNGKSHSGQTPSVEALLLRIEKPDSLIVPSNLVFPSSLRFFFINGLETQLFKSLELQNHFSHLIGLNLDGSLESFPASGFDIPTLQFLSLGPCENLRSLPCNMHNLTSLLTLNLTECPKIESFPERGLPPNLLKLTLEGCEYLRSLPCNLHNHTSLEALELTKCPKVESFPESGWPPNLSLLEICFCDSLETRPLSEWRLDGTSRLQVVRIAGAMEMITSFPDDSLPLPTSLTELYISHFRNLKSISSSIQELTSLKELFIVGCIQLQDLPKEGLPPSVGRLCILVCPYLEKQCKPGKGKYWSLWKGKYWSHLAHIPDYRFIIDPDLLGA